jgi:hypothetical protein
MADSLKKVRAGDRLSIPAGAYNAFVDAALDLRQRQSGISRTAQPGDRQTGIVLVKNASGEDRVRFDVLGLDSPVQLPADNEAEFQNRVAMAGSVPSILRHRGKFAVLLEPIPAGAMGLGIVAGVTVAWVWFESEAHAYADVCDGDAFLLQSYPYGAARVLWKDEPSGADGRWAVVLLGDRGVPEVGVAQDDDAVSGHAEVLSFPGASATEIAPGVVQVDA